MADDTETDIDAIRARHAAATRGPWRLRPPFDPPQEVVSSPAGFVCNTLRGNDRANGEFIAASWQDVADLLAEVDRLRAALKAAGGEGA